MSKAKYLSFLYQIEAIVSIVLQTIFAACSVLKIKEYQWDISRFSWGTFSYVTHTTKNIWWIISWIKLYLTYFLFFIFLKPSESDTKKAPGSIEPIVFFSEDNEFEYKEEK